MSGSGYRRAAALLIAASALGCDDGGAPVRAFHSRQLLSSREPTLNLSGFGLKIVTEQTDGGPISYYDTDPDIAYYSTGSAPSLTYWQLRLSDNSVTEVGSDVTIPSPPGPPSLFECRFETMGSSTTLFVSDPDTQQDLASIDRVVGYTSCPRYADHYLAVIRLDDAGVGRLWTGPFEQIAPANLDLAIDQEVTANWSYEPDPTKQRMTVLAAAGPAPAGRGIYDIDLAQLTTTEVIAPALAGVNWAPGASPSGATASDGLSSSNVDLAYAPGDPHYIYRRHMDDGSDVMFAGPLSPPTSRELALFQISVEPASVDVEGPRGAALPDLFSWQQAAATGSDTEYLLSWDDGNQHFISCPFARGTLPLEAIQGQTRLIGMASPDHSRYAFADYDVLRWDSASSITGALIGLSTAGSGSCDLLAAKNVRMAAVANEAVAWIESVDGSGDQTLWLAGAPGDAPRAVGTMANIDAPIFIAPNTLEVQVGNDVAWLDVRDDPVQMHYVAEQVFGMPTTGSRWLVIGYELSSQDLTGTLGMVDWQTGEKRPISPSVADFIVSSTFSGDRPLNIVYLVKGRSASSQDGIWAATIEAGDLP